MEKERVSRIFVPFEKYSSYLTEKVQEGMVKKCVQSIFSLLVVSLASFFNASFLQIMTGIFQSRGSLNTGFQAAQRAHLNISEVDTSSDPA